LGSGIYTKSILVIPKVIVTSIVTVFYEHPMVPNIILEWLLDSESKFDV
jgi:hypothetical protein